MSKNPFQKMKLLHIQKMLMEQTDDNHGVTVQEIIDYLEAQGIRAERKSIYDDLRTLELFGVDICKEKTKTMKYYVGSRDFELPELKLLVDAVQSSRFITHKKSNQLIKKVERLCSCHQGQLLQRQVYVANRVKTRNEKIYYIIDRLHEAITKDKQITFNYFEWVLNKSGGEKIVKRYRKDGYLYNVSPWALTWDDENYYLIAFCGDSGTIKHFRVDKIDNVTITDKNRQGNEIFSRFDMAVYSKGVFGMFGGNITTVKIQMDNSLVGVAVDRFGKDVFIMPNDDNTFVVTTKVALSQQFFGWLFGLKNKAKLLYPKNAVDDLKEYIRDVYGLY